MPTENWKTSLLNLPPVLSSLTQSRSCGMRMETLLLRSRAAFLTELSSLRSFCVSSTFSTSLRAASGLRLSSSTTICLMRGTRSFTSTLTSLFFVCDSN